jgi:DNA-binding beta-propeller fold protein YncE
VGICPGLVNELLKIRKMGASERLASRLCVGEIVNTKLRKITNYLGACVAAACILWLSGCGGSGGANVVSVSVSPSNATVIVSQSLTLTATVSGATNTDVTWTCTYTTTTVTGTTTKTATAKPCTTDTGNIPTGSNQATVTFTAPSKVPDQTAFPGLVVTVTATSAQDTKKTGTATLVLDSGIFVGITPTTASVPTGEQQTFVGALTNDLQSKGITWLITQTLPTSTIPYPSVATCSPTCGTLSTPVPGSNSITYTAPTTIPTSTTVTSTPAVLTIVATAAGDTTRFTTGTITIVAGGPITFNGISPTIAPAGARLWDIYLDAPNISSASVITLKSTTTGTTTPLTAAGGQVKILFPIPTSTVLTPSSTGARIRLNEQNLSAVDTYTVSVSDPAQPVTTTGTPSFQVLPVRPSTTSSSPNDIVQGASNNELQLVIDGGYFGLQGKNATIQFQGNTVPQQTNFSTSRQLVASLPSNEAGPPGLYPLSVTGNSTPPPAPFPSNSSVTTLAVFPDYSTTAPSVVGSSITAGTNLSAIDIDPTIGVAAVADTGGNAIRFYSITKGALNPLSTVTATTYPGVSINVPTSISVNSQNHSVAVVNYGDQSVSVFPIPGAPGTAITPFNVSLANALPGANTSTTPYAIGVDPDTNLALVAYSNSSTINLANIGFIVNLNSGSAPPYGCINDTSTTKNSGPCVFAQVSLNTGSYPQIAVAPHNHLAFVTPGGSGPTTAVDVTKPSTSTGITSLTLTSGIVTVTTSAAHNLNPANPGTVLITGVTPAQFNGVYSVLAVLSSTSFEYALTSTTNSTGTGGTVFYSSPNLVFGISQTAQGIAINPITRTAALADANATGSNGPQIDLINSLDQSITSITFNATCTNYVSTCASAPELLGTTGVAWQPYSNALVSYNPALNQVSVSDPTSQRRYALACQNHLACTTNPVDLGQISLTGTGTATINVANAPGGTLKLFGGIAVDPDTNQAIVVMSGSSSIELIDLGPLKNPGGNDLKTTQITEVVVPSLTPGPGVSGGVPNALVPNATLTSATNLSGVKIFGSGFGAAGNTAVQVRLDGLSINSNTLCPGSACVSVINDREVDVTIPTQIPTADPNNPIHVLGFPHKFALDVVSSGVTSNATDFYVIKAVDLSTVCTGTLAPAPTSVAIADQLKNGPFSPIAVVSNSGCTSISVVDINPSAVVGGNTVLNPTFGVIKNTITVGKTPQGVAIDQHRGLAVVANNGDNTASVIDLTTNPPSQKVAAVTVGTTPSGVAINDSTDVAIVANTGSNSVSLIDLSLLFPPTGTTAPTTLTAISAGVDQQPIAVAIDPDRGTNNQGIAVVTALELVSGSAPFGALDVVDIGIETPAKSTTISTGNVSATPTGVVFDPTVITGTTNNGVFYSNSSGSNVISSFNPDTGGATSVSVGINPTSLAINPQTGAILTSNTLGKTISIVDTLSSPIKTKLTLGLPGSPLLGVAIDPFTNLAVIVDQANNRLLIFPMPN